MRITLLSGLILIWCFTLPPVLAFETDQHKCDNELDCATQSVVSLLPDWPENFTRNEEPEGSGIVLGDGTLVATADHVLGPAKTAHVRTRSGLVLKADIVMRDPMTDIAFLRINKKQIPFQNFKNISVSEPACAIGNSFGLDISVTCGVISAKEVTGVGFNRIEDFLQTDASVNPGMSGGALVDEKGNLLGMLSAIFTRKSDANIGVNFAVSGNLLFKVLNDFQEYGRVQYQQSGILVRPNDPKTSKGYIGAMVMRVEDPSREKDAGIKVGDIILKVGKRKIKRAGAYEAAIAVAPKNTDLNLLLLRDNEFMNVKLKSR